MPNPVIAYLGDTVQPIAVRKPGKEAHQVYAHNSKSPGRVYLVFECLNFDPEKGHDMARAMADAANAANFAPSSMAAEVETPPTPSRRKGSVEDRPAN